MVELIRHVDRSYKRPFNGALVCPGGWSPSSRREVVDNATGWSSGSSQLIER